MRKPYLVAVSLLLVIGFSSPSFAGGPICGPKMCPPAMCAPMCAPPVCAPPMAMNPCMPPAPCAPPACQPPTCGPAKVGCEEGPLEKVFKGACMLVTGVVALPFKLVDCMFGGSNCPPKTARCGYERMPAACGPTMACMPPMCAPMPCYPGIGCGVPGGMPVGFGYGAPRSKKFRPFAENNGLPISVAAGPQTIFGSYW